MKVFDLESDLDKWDWSYINLKVLSKTVEQDRRKERNCSMEERK